MRKVLLAGPAGRRPGIDDGELGDDLRATLEEPELRNRFEVVGTFARPSSIPQTMAFIKAEQDQWRPIVRQIGAD